MEGSKRRSGVCFADSLAWLTGAIDHGLTNDDDPGTDPLLKPLQGDPAFEALAARQRAKIAATAKPVS
jgi:hypothetical protein